MGWLGSLRGTLEAVLADLVSRRHGVIPNLFSPPAANMLQKLMGMASAQGNVVAALGQPIHMVQPPLQS